MAYAPWRSCCDSLYEGMTDGAYKKAVMNRGGWVEGDFAGTRKLMSGTWHGFNEAFVKYLPDGRQLDDSPYYINIAPVDKDNT